MPAIKNRAVSRLTQNVLMHVLLASLALDPQIGIPFLLDVHLESSLDINLLLLGLTLTANQVTPVDGGIEYLATGHADLFDNGVLGHARGIDRVDFGSVRGSHVFSFENDLLGRFSEYGFEYPEQWCLKLLVDVMLEVNR